MFSVFSSGTSTPVKAFIRLCRSVYVRCHEGSLPCTTNSLASPPQISKIILAAISDPQPGEVGSRPLSKRYLASVIIFNFRPVDAVLTGSKMAASRNIFTVWSSHPDLSPPIIPAKSSTPSSSPITIMSSPNVYSLPSRARYFSSVFASLIKISPFILSASYACNGLPRSNIT